MKRIIDVTTVRKQFGTLLDEVFYRGDTITIKRKGKFLAQLGPCEELNNSDVNFHLSPTQKKLFQELHSLPIVSIDKDPTIILRNIRKQKKLKVKLNNEKK